MKDLKFRSLKGEILSSLSNMKFTSIFEAQDRSL